MRATSKTVQLVLLSALRRAVLPPALVIMMSGCNSASAGDPTQTSEAAEADHARTSPEQGSSEERAIQEIEARCRKSEAPYFQGGHSEDAAREASVEGCMERSGHRDAQGVFHPTAGVEYKPGMGPIGPWTPAGKGNDWIAYDGVPWPTDEGTSYWVDTIYAEYHAGPDGKPFNRTIQWQEVTCGAPYKVRTTYTWLLNNEDEVQRTKINNEAVAQPGSRDWQAAAQACGDVKGEIHDFKSRDLLGKAQAYFATLRRRSDAENQPSPASPSGFGQEAGANLKQPTIGGNNASTAVLNVGAR